MKRILIIGSGGREHALAWKLLQSPQIESIFVAPGNGGTAAIVRNVDIEATDINGLLSLCREELIDFVVVGPELPLSLGIVDRFNAEGLPAFGPSGAAARLETSKVFSKEFMTRHNIPTAPYRIARGLEEARAHVRDIGLPVAVKADGLAAGKGVTVCRTVEQADEALRRILVDRVFGDAGQAVVIEAGLSGEEVSVLSFCDQYTIVPMLAAQDHKAAFDGDRGPNTGGMGCYAPAPFLNDGQLEFIWARFLQAAVDGMRDEGVPYRGVLYAGLMLTEDGPQLLEFNVRFGDPETEVILPLLETDLFEVLQACAHDHLAEAAVRWLPETCACIVCAAGGYPGPYAKGDPITGLAEAERDGALVFHAGTQREGESIVTSGGRALAITGRAPDLPSAIDKTYQAVRRVHFDGMHYRNDIGAKALRHHGVTRGE